MSAEQLICPGCGGAKTRRARICASCRRRAIELGVQAVLETAGRGPQPDVEMIGPRQVSAFYAKTDELDRILERPYRTGHDLALERASEHFGRPITSVNELAYAEASWVLDRLSEQVAAAKSALVEA